MITFGLIGDGRAAQNHRYAIEKLGGKLKKVVDPKFSKTSLDKSFFRSIDYVCICSPTYCHYDQVKMALESRCKVICEKPYVLPWQPVIDSDDVSIVLQLRWLLQPFKKVDRIRVTAVRDEEYFSSWKGDPLSTGGLFFNVFIHYIDLARKHDCWFEGQVKTEGKQERFIDDLDLSNVDMKYLYRRMYEDIVYHDAGIKPSHVSELHWLLSRYTERFGAGIDVIGKRIRIKPNSLF